MRVLLDAFGCARMHEEARRRLEHSECRVRWFRPLMPMRLTRNDKRTHRKILVCDNRLAFTGGVGIADEWEGDARNPGEWRETHFGIEGPAAADIRAGFFDNWLDANPGDIRCPEPFDVAQAAGGSGIMTLYSTANDFWSKIGSLFHVMFAAARKSIRICSPYVVPDETSTRLLREAIARGVLVEILMPMEHLDQRVTAFAGRERTVELIRAGARVWHYNRTMLHAKVILVDGHFACVGSANFNQRSKRKDDELCVVIRDAAVVATLARQFDEDRDDPHTRPASSERTLLRRMLARLVQPIREQT